MANDEGIPEGWVRQCIDRIVDECGYASYNELAIALGKNRANIDAWIARNTYGRDGMTSLHDKTGADANWLLARGEVAFPTGPVINEALKSARIYGSLTEIRKQILEFARALAETKPELASAWKERLEGAEPAAYQEKAFRGLLLGLLESESESRASSNTSVQAAQVHAKRGQGKRK